MKYKLNGTEISHNKKDILAIEMLNKAKELGISLPFSGEEEDLRIEAVSFSNKVFKQTDLIDLTKFNEFLIVIKEDDPPKPDPHPLKHSTQFKKSVLESSSYCGKRERVKIEGYFVWPDDYNHPHGYSKDEYGPSSGVFVTYKGKPVCSQKEFDAIPPGGEFGIDTNSIGIRTTAVGIFRKAKKDTK